MELNKRPEAIELLYHGRFIYDQLLRGDREYGVELRRREHRGTFTVNGTAAARIPYSGNQPDPSYGASVPGGCQLKANATNYEVWNEEGWRQIR
jgi:hypothetical protein